jgi:hypothetical protein
VYYRSKKHYISLHILLNTSIRILLVVDETMCFWITVSIYHRFFPNLKTYTNCGFFFTLHITINIMTLLWCDDDGGVYNVLDYLLVSHRWPGDRTCQSIIEYLVVIGPHIDWLKDRGLYTCGYLITYLLTSGNC